jgi:glycosyltransferase involved in cell wall biosynthesis
LIAIIVAAHNAQDKIDACLESLMRAARHPALADEDVQITVVLNHCDDRTGWLARSWGVHTMDVHSGQACMARRSGADAAVRAGARWLAFADADTTVAEDWLAAQIAQSTDVVSRVVYDGVLDTAPDADLHGVNFGLSAKAYVAARDAKPAPAPAPREPAARDTTPVMAKPQVLSGGSGGRGARPILQRAASPRLES